MAGLVTVAQFSFWGNYLPGAFPLHLRGTGEGFAANVGGRMIGTGFAAVTAQLVNFIPGASAPASSHTPPRGRGRLRFSGGIAAQLRVAGTGNQPDFSGLTAVLGLRRVHIRRADFRR